MKKLTDNVRTAIMEYINETDPDSAVYRMEDMDEIIGEQSASWILARSFHGYSYVNHNEAFNPNMDYFSFNGYGNFVSYEETDLDQYLDMFADESFIAWANENGYSDAVEEYKSLEN